MDHQQHGPHLPARIGQRRAAQDLRRFLADGRVTFAAYNVASDSGTYTHTTAVAKLEQIGGGGAFASWVHRVIGGANMVKITL